MMKRLLVINGHPDPRPERFCNALSDAYARGAGTAGWQTRRLNAGNLPLSAMEGSACDAATDDCVLETRGDIDWSNRLAIVFPLWFEQPPETLCALLGNLIDPARRRRAHIIVTMEMPAFAYRSLLRAGAPGGASGLALPGVIAEEPVLIGCVNTISREQRRAWLEMVRRYGERSTFGTVASPSRSFSAMIDRTVAQWWHG